MKLQEYIDTYGIKKTALARILKVNRATIHRICTGNTCGVALAKRIQVVTRGEVTVSETLGLDADEL
jgi:plasmid maintenance system antidote protein VapI